MLKNSTSSDTRQRSQLLPRCPRQSHCHAKRTLGPIILEIQILNLILLTYSDNIRGSCRKRDGRRPAVQGAGNVISSRLLSRQVHQQWTAHIHLPAGASANQPSDSHCLEQGGWQALSSHYPGVLPMIPGPVASRKQALYCLQVHGLRAVPRLKNIRHRHRAPSPRITKRP